MIYDSQNDAPIELDARNDENGSASVGIRYVYSERSGADTGISVN